MGNALFEDRRRKIPASAGPGADNFMFGTVYRGFTIVQVGTGFSLHNYAILACPAGNRKAYVYGGYQTLREAHNAIDRMVNNLNGTVREIEGRNYKLVLV